MVPNHQPDCIVIGQFYIILWYYFHPLLLIIVIIHQPAMSTSHGVPFFFPQRSQVLQVLQASQVRRVARQELGHVVVGGFHGVQVRLGTDNGRSSEDVSHFLGENMVKLCKKWEILGWSSRILVNIEHMKILSIGIISCLIKMIETTKQVRCGRVVP